jgi:hypothetical protein
MKYLARRRGSHWITPMARTPQQGLNLAVTRVGGNLNPRCNREDRRTVFLGTVAMTVPPGPPGLNRPQSVDAACHWSPGIVSGGIRGHAAAPPSTAIPADLLPSSTRAPAELPGQIQLRPPAGRCQNSHSAGAPTWTGPARPRLRVVLRRDIGHDGRLPAGTDNHAAPARGSGTKCRIPTGSRGLPPCGVDRQGASGILC